MIDVNVNIYMYVVVRCALKLKYKLGIVKKKIFISVRCTELLEHFTLCTENRAKQRRKKLRVTKQNGKLLFSKCLMCKIVLQMAKMYTDIYSSVSNEWRKKWRNEKSNPTKMKCKWRKTRIPSLKDKNPFYEIRRCYTDVYNSYDFLIFFSLWMLNVWCSLWVDCWQQRSRKVCLCGTLNATHSF